MTIEIIIVHPPDYNEQANLPVVSLLSLRKKDGLSNTVYRYYHGKFSTKFSTGAGYPAHIFFLENPVDGAAVIVHFTETLPSAVGCGVV